MNSISIPIFEHKGFLKFVSLKTEYDGVNNYFIDVQSDGTSVVYPSYGEHTVKYEGDEFIITFKEEGNPVGDGAIYYTRLLVKHSDIDKLKNFVTNALTYEKANESHKVKIKTSCGKGYWETRDSIYAQTMDNIHIPEDVKDSIESTIDKFIENKKRYIEFGRSYKYCFLLSGQAGSGKTSIVKAIAIKYNRTIYVINFTKVMTDDSMIDLFNEIKDDSILLIEDIDSFFMDRKAQDINVSFSVLINLLDGAMAKGNGTLIFITANNPDRLDPALIRPGRTDMIIKFDYPKKKEIMNAFFKLTEKNKDEFETFYGKIRDIKTPMSGIIDYLFRYPNEYMKHVDELMMQSRLLKEIVNDKTDKMYS